MKRARKKHSGAFKAKSPWRPSRVSAPSTSWPDTLKCTRPRSCSGSNGCWPGPATLFTGGVERDLAEEAALRTGSTRKSDRLKVELDWLKKSLSCSLERRRSWIDPHHRQLSVRCQCRLLPWRRQLLLPARHPSPRRTSATNVCWTRSIPGIPSTGAQDDLLAAGPGPRGGTQTGAAPAAPDGLDGRVSQAPLELEFAGHRRFPYLLKGVAITRPNQVWSTDITYIRYAAASSILSAILDWYSRTCWPGTCPSAGDRGVCGRAGAGLARPAAGDLQHRSGVQFHQRAVPSAAPGRPGACEHGRAWAGVRQHLCRRLWRTVKYEEVYLKDYPTWRRRAVELADYFPFYNNERIHSGAGLSDTAGRALCAPMSQASPPLLDRRGARAKAGSPPPAHLSG